MFKRKHIRIWAIIIVIVIVLAMILMIAAPLLTNAATTTAPSLSDQLKQQQQKATDLQNQISAANSQMDTAMQQKETIDGQLTSLQSDMDDINTQITSLNTQIASKNSDIAAAQATIDAKMTQYQQRFRVLYEQGSLGYITMLMQSTSITDFLYRYNIMEAIIKNDRDLLDQMQAAQQTIIDAKNAIQQDETNVESQKSALADKQSQVVSAQKQQQQIIDNLTANTAEYQKQLDAAEAAQNSLKAQIAGTSSNSSSSTYTGGKFTWPVPGHYTITSPFSPARLDPVTHVVQPHTGIDIGAPLGTAVVAAGDGTVVFAAWNGGYGNCVIIDHGGGYTTLYGHSSKLEVTKGQKVTKGQEIMKVGSTGMSTGPHCHFEVDINGVPHDPVQYLQGQ